MTRVSSRHVAAHVPSLAVAQNSSTSSGSKCPGSDGIAGSLSGSGSGKCRPRPARVATIGKSCDQFVTGGVYATHNSCDTDRGARHGVVGLRHSGGTELRKDGEARNGIQLPRARRLPRLSGRASRPNARLRDSELTGLARLIALDRPRLGMPTPQRHQEKANGTAPRDPGTTRLGDSRWRVRGVMPGN